MKKFVFVIILVLLASNSFALSKKQLLGIMLSSDCEAYMESEESVIVWKVNDNLIYINYIEDMNLVVCFKFHTQPLTEKDYFNININTPLNIIEYDGDKIVYYKFVLVDENAIEHIELNLLAAAILLDNF